MFDVIGEIDFLEAKGIEVTNACLEHRFRDVPEPICLKESRQCKKTPKKALQYMLPKIGGFQVQGYTLQPANGANAEVKANFYWTE